jgi:hypothetical protein
LSAITQPRVTRTPGEPKTDEIFDPTAPIAVKLYANNVQSVLVPSGQRWFKLITGPDIPPDKQHQVELQLQENTRTFFKHLDQSNFAFAINESFQDMTISTGVLLMNQGTADNPFRFQSGPMRNMAFEEGADQELENFWQRWEIPARQILRLWPNAELPESLRTKVTDSPNEIVRLIEGTIFYPDNAEDKQVFYYVQHEDTKADIVKEFKNYRPWMGFRLDVSPGEIIGRGPVLTLLPAIKSLNKISEFELKAAKWRSHPPFVADATSVVNAYNMVIEPGSIIPVNASLGGGLPIQPLQYGGDPRFDQMKSEEFRSMIRQVLFSEPLSPNPTPVQSATEVSIRQQNWIRQSGTAFGRIRRGLLGPIVIGGMQILTNLGLIKPVKIDGKEVVIEYQSPLLDIQSQDDVKRAQEWIQELQLVFGPKEALLAMNIEEYPPWLAEKTNVDERIVKDNEQIRSSIRDFAQQMQQSQQGPPQPGVADIPQVQPFAPAQQ